MSLLPSITETAINTAIGDFIEAQLGVPTVVGQVNRVPQPAANSDSVVFWYRGRPRLATNAITDNDVKFTASISGTDLNVSAVAQGAIVVGSSLSATGVATGTTILSQSSGTPGGPGNYAVSVSQTVASETMSAGYEQIMQETELLLQIDVHGPNSGDNAQVLSTLLRSGFAVDSLSPSGVTPLYCEDPVQTPFQTAADQYEERWTIEARFQVDPIISLPQQYTDQLTITDYNVDQPPS